MTPAEALVNINQLVYPNERGLKARRDVLGDTLYDYLLEEVTPRVLQGVVHDAAVLDLGGWAPHAGAFYPLELLELYTPKRELLVASDFDS